MVNYSQEPYLDSEEEYKRYLRDLLANSGGDLTGSQTLPDGTIMGFAANDLASKQRIAPQPPQMLPEQQQAQTQPMSALMNPQQPQQQSEAFRKQQIGNGLRNESTGAQYDLPSAPPVAVRGGSAAGELLNFGQRNNVPKDDLMAMIQYQASSPNGPSAQDLYTQSFQYGTPVKELISAYSTMGAGARNAEKENLGLQKQRGDIEKQRVDIEKAQRDAMHGRRTSTMSTEARLGYELKNGLIDQSTYDTAMAGTQGGKAMAAKAAATEKATVKSLADQEKRDSDYKTQIGRFDEMLGEIDKLVDGSGKGKDELKSYAGPYDQLTPTVFPTASRGQSALEALRNKLTIKNLAEAKKEAGQSFGAMAVKEWPRFENMHAYLDPTINDKVLAENLQEYRTKLVKAKNDIETAYRAKAGGAQPTTSAQVAPETVGRGDKIMSVQDIMDTAKARNKPFDQVLKDARAAGWTVK